MPPPISTTPSGARSMGAVTLMYTTPMMEATVIAGSSTMNKCVTSVRIGTAALRLPLMAPISPGRTLLLMVFEIS